MNKLSVFCLALISLALFSCRGNMPDVDDVFFCDQFWSTVDLSDYCGMDIDVHFDILGDVGVCHANFNESLPGDEFIFITVGNLDTEKEASDEFERIKMEDSSADTFVEISGVGDDAYAFVDLDGMGGPDSIIIETRKGQYTATIEIRFITNDNCLDENTSYDFARAVIAGL